MKKVLIIGGSSLLAHSLSKVLKKNYEVILSINKTIPEVYEFQTLNLNFQSIKKLTDSISSIESLDLIINCIGYTNVEECEINYNHAVNLNIDYPRMISQVCKDFKIKFVHISTDHLSDGSKSFVKEDDKVVCLNKYAKSKYKGELEVLKNNSDSIILRTNFFCWGPSYKNSFSDFIINNLEMKSEIYLFEDVYFTPISVKELVNIMLSLVELNSSGIYNAVSNERISKYDFGILISNIFQMNSDLIKKTLFTKRSDLTERPLDMSLSTEKIINLGIEVKSLREQIIDLRNEILYESENVIPYGRQNINEDDIDEVSKILRSDFLTQGPTVISFEHALSSYTNSKYSVAVNSATSALHISCLALGVEEDDIVWTSPISFVASSNCAIYCGAKVDFVDIDKDSYNMSVEKLEKKLELAKKNNQLPKVVIPVHLSGQSCDMKKIHILSKKYGFKIIEDASHAIGASYLGNKVGCCKYSDITVFSFHPVKIITSGEGGACTTNDKNIANLLARFRSHGITRHEVEMDQKSHGPWYYQQINLGFNYRMTDIQAALGLNQLKRLDKFISKRHEIAARYNSAFRNVNILTPKQEEYNYSSYHLYIIRLRTSMPKLDKLSLFKMMRKNGILVNLHYIPIYKHPYYKKIGYNDLDFPESEKYYEEAISIPIHTLLKKSEQDYVIQNILRFIGKQKSLIINVENKKQIGFQNIF